MEKGLERFRINRCYSQFTIVTFPVFESFFHAGFPRKGHCAQRNASPKLHDPHPLGISFALAVGSIVLTFSISFLPQMQFLQAFFRVVQSPIWAVLGILSSGPSRSSSPKSSSLSEPACVLAFLDHKLKLVSGMFIVKLNVTGEGKVTVQHSDSIVIVRRRLSYGGYCFKHTHACCGSNMLIYFESSSAV